MNRFFRLHFLEHVGGRGVIGAKAIGKVRVDAAVFLLERNRQRQDFSFGQLFKRSGHGTLGARGGYA
jgi:hypothetical protein